MSGGKEHSKGWVPEELYSQIQRSVPIVCVDVLVYRRVGSTDLEVGLIRRDTPTGDGWCLVGGGVQLNESLEEALSRHTAATLGPPVEKTMERPRLVTVGEYFSDQRAGELFDPRKHAVALTFISEVHAHPDEIGDEALEFRWYAIDVLSNVAFGFGQGEIVRRCLPEIR